MRLEGRGEEEPERGRWPWGIFTVHTAGQRLATRLAGLRQVQMERAFPRQGSLLAQASLPGRDLLASLPLCGAGREGAVGWG